jgi:hypothetical protein
MDRAVPRHRRTRDGKSTEQPRPVATGRRSRAAMFVAWNVKPAETWPLNGPAPGESLPIGVGHRYLCRLLLVHDMLSRQGVAAASGALSQSEIDDAIDACTYFELFDLAAVVAEIPLAGSSPLSARVFDAEYHRRYATTDRVVDAILEHLAARPEDFPGDTE